MLTSAFKRVTLADIAQEDLASGAAPRIAATTPLYPAAELVLPAHAFGDTSPPDLPPSAYDPAMQWGVNTNKLREVFGYELVDAVVHPPHGVVTIGDKLLAETLGHIPFHLPGYNQDGDIITLPAYASHIDVDRAVHAAAGNYANYFHWLLENLPKLQCVAPFAKSGLSGTIVLPPIETSFQRDALSLFNRGSNPLFVMSHDCAVRAKSLSFLPNLAGAGFAPNPHLKHFYDKVRALLGVEVTTPTRRIYISRRDSPRRVLSNESEVAALVSRYGFEVVETSGLSFREQVALFTAASHVIAPHGAGLSNIVFCAAGTPLLELMMDTYMNSCFRRLATVRNMRYGCLVGTANLADQTWTAPVNRLEAVLSNS